MMDFWYDWWTSIGVLHYMLEDFYLDILYVSSFFIKNIQFSNIKKIHMSYNKLNREADCIVEVVGKCLVFQQMVSFGALSRLRLTFIHNLKGLDACPFKKGADWFLN